MPIHDWTRAEAGDFHYLHQCWVVAISNALNWGILLRRKPSTPVLCHKVGKSMTT